MPRFNTVIPTDGPSGNINVILANAMSLMKQLDVPDIDRVILRSAVTRSLNYEEACNAIREWFPLAGEQ
jgi:hypothetical protein